MDYEHDLSEPYLDLRTCFSVELAACELHVSSSRAASGLQVPRRHEWSDNFDDSHEW